MHFDYARIQREFKFFSWGKVLANEDFSRIPYWTENNSLTNFIYLQQTATGIALAIHLQRKFINIVLFIWLEVISSFQISGVLLLEANAKEQFGAHPEQYIAVKLSKPALDSDIQAAAQIKT